MKNLCKHLRLIDIMRGKYTCFWLRKCAFEEKKIKQLNEVFDKDRLVRCHKKFYTCPVYIIAKKYYEK